MLKNYLKIAIRNLSRHKLFSFINIFGLALSMSICLLVLIHVNDQLSYDKFHPKADRIYRVITELTNNQGSSFRYASSALTVAPALSSNYNFIEKSARLYNAAAGVASTGKKEIAIKTAFTDPGFFDLFGFTLSAGNPATALTAPNSIVLTKETATKFFGKGNPLGQTISLTRIGSFQITGVMDVPKGKSHIDFEAYLSMSSVAALEKNGALPPMLDKGDSQGNTYTYLLLKEGSTKKQLNAAVDRLSATLRGETKLQGKESFDLHVQPFKKIILGEELQNSIGKVGTMGKLLAEVLIGFIILLSACFNYTNLSIARSLNRGKEVGIRKVAGAFRHQVFYQFILESVLIAFLSFALAYFFLNLMIDHAPFIGEMSLPDLSFNSGIFLWFILFTLFTGLLAGALPAWILSSFKPVEVLKNLSNIKLFGGNNFRKGLIIIQFTLALVTTIFTAISSRQFNYIATADPGYDRENLLIIPLQGADHKILSAEISRLSAVQNITATSTMLGRNTSGRSNVRLQPGTDPIQMDYYAVDQNFIAAMNLKLLAGTTFPGNINIQGEKFVIVNETAIRILNLKAPIDAVGKSILLNDTTQVQIAGVLKDFHYQGLAVQNGPLMLRYRPEDYNFLAVKTIAANAEVVSEIETIWKNNFPQQPFTSSWFGEDLYKRQSASDTVSMLGFLAFMCITIACLGLLGMVIYNTETRRKEIGIRKVMGASVAAIVSMLSKSFVKLVVIAGLIGLPISYLCGFFFLNIFANRINISFGSLLLSFLGLLAIVLITISSQIFKIATANPVHSLRRE